MIVAYIATAVCLRLVFDTKEIFPIFSWSLFSVIPTSPHEDIGVLVTEIDGNPLNPYADFMTAKNLFSQAGSIEAYYVIQRLGKAVLAQDDQTENSSRRLLEGQYVDGFKSNLKYRIVKRRYDPIERWKNGSFQFEPLKEYSIQRKSA